MSIKNYQIRIKALSPIHIGSGETLDPMRYTVKNGRLYLLKEGQYIKKLLQMPNSQLEKVVESGNVYTIAQYYYDCFDETDKSVWYNSYEVSPGFQNTFINNLKNPDSQNLLYEFYKSDLMQEPVIPGSTIKGAIRTAILYQLNLIKDMKFPKFQDSQRAESMIMNMERFDPKSDPFKYIKISDIPVHSTSLTVKKVENKTVGRKSAIPYYAEVIADFENTFSGSLQIDSRFARGFDQQTVINDQDIKGFIIQSCRDFYLKNIKTDIAHFEKLGLKESLRPLVTKIAGIGKSPNKIFIRLGKGQGCHSLGIFPENHSPKSRNVTENLSLGWAEIEFEEI